MTSRDLDTTMLIAVVFIDLLFAVMSFAMFHTAYSVLREIPSIRRENALREERIQRITGIPVMRLGDAALGALVAVSAQIVDGGSDVTPLGSTQVVGPPLVDRDVVLDDGSGRRVLVVDKSANARGSWGRACSLSGRLNDARARAHFAQRTRSTSSCPRAKAGTLSSAK
jgi:hypothetical protein